MFNSEANGWYDNMPSILAKNIMLSGASPLYPDAHCTKTGEVYQLTTGEGEINAASSITALIYSDLFNLTRTYFLVVGIAGINPHVALPIDCIAAKPKDVAVQIYPSCKPIMLQV